jgi:hypothetical protein
MLEMPRRFKLFAELEKGEKSDQLNGISYGLENSIYYSYSSRGGQQSHQLECYYFWCPRGIFI